MQAPAAREAQDGGGEARHFTVRLDDAEVLLHKATGELQRMAWRRGEIPRLIRQPVDQRGAIQTEPVGKLRGQMRNETLQHLAAGVLSFGQNGEHVVMSFGQ